MAELRLIEVFGKGNVSVYSESETNKELRKLLNKAWDAGKMRIFGWRAPNSLVASRRYRDVSKVIKEAKPKEEQP